MRGRVQKLFGITIACAMLTTGVALAASPPTPVTGGTTSIFDSSATLHGTVNPNGSATTYYFEWGTTTSYGSTGDVKSAGNGSKAVPTAESIGRLAPGTTYHYALVAMNSNGTRVGSDQTFTTTPAPVASTGPVTQLSTSSATLSGTVNPSGQTTTWYFQWGAGGLSQQTIPKTIGPSTSPQSVSYPLNGLLRPGTLYHYRLVASHTRSPSVTGSVATFLTYPPSPSYTRVIEHTHPLHVSQRPYTFTTYGVVVHPYWIPAQFACVGEVTIGFFHKHHRVRHTTVALQPNCRYSAVTVFHHLPGHGKWQAPVRLRVIAKFLQNPYLAASRSRTVHVLVG